jgi:hypothetical protein
MDEQKQESEYIERLETLQERADDKLYPETFGMVAQPQRTRREGQTRQFPE